MQHMLLGQVLRIDDTLTDGDITALCVDHLCPNHRPRPIHQTGDDTPL